jgi:uncharacterized protein YdeI (YjbR/CyaY-like superfamily)
VKATDPRVDAYIKKSADFAQPILKHLRATVHAASAEIEETMKWSFPHFMYKGMLCGMAAFKEHATFGFWKGSLIVDRKGRPVEEAMGQFGRITKIAELPAKKLLIGYIKEAMRLNDEGVPSPARLKKKQPRPLIVPPELTAALKKNAKARATFESFSVSNRREYAEWIAEAKRAETRTRRLATAIDWLARGRTRNWKYAKC